MGLHIPYQTFEYRGRRANTLPLVPGQTEEVTFTAGTPGEYEFSHNVVGHRLPFPDSVGGIFPGPATNLKVYQGIEWFSQLAGLQ